GDHGGQGDGAHAEVVHIAGVVRERVAQLGGDANVGHVLALGEDHDGGAYRTAYVFGQVDVDIVDRHVHERLAAAADVVLEAARNLDDCHELALSQLALGLLDLHRPQVERVVRRRQRIGE